MRQVLHRVDPARLAIHGDGEIVGRERLGMGRPSLSTEDVHRHEVHTGSEHRLLGLRWRLGCGAGGGAHHEKERSSRSGAHVGLS